jgi:outer membrane murein-binding lipoprotein Lpp
MRRRFLLIAAVVAGATPAAGQALPNGPREYTITLPAADIDQIGNALQELPAKIANPITARLIDQIKAQNEAHAKKIADEKPTIEPQQPKPEK